MSERETAAVTWKNLVADQTDAMVLPGGHAQGMCPYLESVTLQEFVADFFETVGAADQHKPAV